MDEEADEKTWFQNLVFKFNLYRYAWACTGYAGRTLLLLGVDPTTKTNPDIGEQANMTPLDIARHKGHAEIAADLRHPANLCAARQRLALAVGMADAAHALLGALPYDLLQHVCEEAQAAGGGWTLALASGGIAIQATDMP